jgi:hypothetical protein
LKNGGESKRGKKMVSPNLEAYIAGSTWAEIEEMSYEKCMELFGQGKAWLTAVKIVTEEKYKRLG